WIPELQKYCPGVPYLLVGTRIDLRNDQRTLDNLARDGKTPISRGQGERMAKELQAVKYVECSALTKENINDVFQEGIIIALSDNTVTTTPPKAKIRDDNAASFTNTNTNSNIYNTNYNNSSSPNRNDDAECCCCDACCNSQNCTIL
ncbi:hypothetical protein ILUMI_06685, partial [Ignelater luminosus]